MTRTSRWLGAVSLCVLAGLAASPATAAGVVAGTTITNTVSVAYQVGTVQQTAISASDTFTVDRKVNVLVSDIGSQTITYSPGQTSTVTTFKVENLSNGTLDFGLTAL